MSPIAVELKPEGERGPDHPIARLRTARAAFVGRTLRGPVNRPLFLRSFAEFQHFFGGLWQPSPLGHAVEQFFDNGGREAVVVRVVNAARAATLTLRAGDGVLRLRAVCPGTREFLRVSVDYDNVDASNSREFNLTVQRVRVPGTAQVEDQEIFLRLSVDPAAARYLGRLLAESELVQPDEIPTMRPDRTLDATSGLATAYVHSNAGDDGAPLTDYDVIGSEIEKSGLFALDDGDYFNLLCIPPLSREQDVGITTLAVAARFCKERRALLVVDPPAAWHTADEALRGMRKWPLPSENAVMYFPRILAQDRLQGHSEPFAPCGAVAGLMARADEASPVWGPARMEEAILRPGFRPTCLVGEDRRMRLAALGVNTLQAVRSATRLGVAPRTLASSSAGVADWQGLTSRRLALYLISSIERGTRWTALAAPHADVAGRVQEQVQAFFERLYDGGALGDRSAAESYFVVCDAPLAPPVVGKGGFQLVIGFAAARRHEFHTFRIVHTRTGSTVTAVSLNRLNSMQYSPEEIQWVDRLAGQLEG